MKSELPRIKLALLDIQLSNLLHALVKNGVTAGLTDDQVSPLHHHDGHEERSVASVLKDLAVVVGL